MKHLNLKEYGELVGLIAIVVTLAVLIVEVRENTLAIERQTALDRANSQTSPFFDSELATILDKIKSQDGPDPNILLFVEAYGLSYREAIIWERHLQYVWSVLEAEFDVDGPSASLENTILSLLISRDNQLYVQATSGFRFGEEFQAYVADLQNRVDEFRELMAE
jgi:hypothetical protein